MVTNGARHAIAVTALLVAAVLLSTHGIRQAQPYLFDRENGMVHNNWQNVTRLKDSKYIKTVDLDSDRLVSSAAAKSFA